MTIVYKAKRWDISLGRYVKHRGTADYLKSIRVEKIIPGTGEDVDPSLIDDQGRYDPGGGTSDRN
jgi:hypothetical protein